VVAVSSRALRLGFAAVVAIVLHATFCEWRTRDHSVAQRAEARARLLVELGAPRAHEPNHASWDAAARAFLRDNLVWTICHRAIHGARVLAGPGFSRCLAGRDFDTATARAVAAAACERELHGGLREPERLGRCLTDLRVPGDHVPRWTSERIGHRHEAPWEETRGVWAESRLPWPWLDRALAWALGVAAPVVALAIALRRRPAP